MLFLSKNAKIRNVKIFKKNSITPRNYTLAYYQTLEEVPWFVRLDKPKKPQKFSKTLKKFESFVKKNAKIRMLKCRNHSITNRNYAVNYYQTIEWVP